MVIFLYDSDPNEILQNILSMIRPIELWNCEIPTLFVLYKLLKTKNVLFPIQSETEKAEKLFRYFFCFCFLTTWKSI